MLFRSIREVPLPEGKEYPYIMPGFIDSHVHIESSMVLPQEFAKAAVAHGTIGTVSDPHEIANVLGKEGVRYMIEQSQRTPFNILFGAPSCVPACGGDMETSGAVLNAKEVEELLAMKEIGYLAEVMNYPGVLNRDEEVMAKINAAHRLGKPVDGHAPGLKGGQRKQYAAAGITADHECFSLEEGRDCIKAGMKVQIRVGSAAKDYIELHPLIDEYPDMVMFCTDDSHSEDLLHAEIDMMVKHALQDGHDLWNVLLAACVNPQRHYGLKWGLLQVGDVANFIIVNELNYNLRVQKTILKGKVVYDRRKGVTLRNLRRYFPHTYPNRFKAKPVTEEDIRLDLQQGDVCPVIVAKDGGLITRQESLVYTDEETMNREHDWNEVQKIVVLNRYQEDAKPVVGLIRGFHLVNKGALASSVAHDCHNIVAIGSDDACIVRAINRVIKMKGGQVAICGTTMAELALPIAGIMSPEDVVYVADKCHELRTVATEAGCTMNAPFITMAFMCLPVIPELKITDKCIWDSANFRPVAFGRQ